MAKIVVTKPSDHALDELGVRAWEIWTCEAGTFDWHYEQKETCYLLEGDVTVTAKDDQATFGAGDLVIFPEGLDCKWEVRLPVKKHYKMG